MKILAAIFNTCTCSQILGLHWAVGVILAECLKFELYSTYSVSHWF